MRPLRRSERPRLVPSWNAWAGVMTRVGVGGLGIDGGLGDGGVVHPESTKAAGSNRQAILVFMVWELGSMICRGVPDGNEKTDDPKERSPTDGRAG